MEKSKLNVNIIIFMNMILLIILKKPKIIIYELNASIVKMVVIAQMMISIFALYVRKIFVKIVQKFIMEIMI